MFTAQVSAAARGASGWPWLRWLPLLAVWFASTVYVVAGLPDVPVQKPDSIEYIKIASNRPPAFGWILHGLRSAGLVGPDYAGVPLIQTALISAGLLAFSLELALLLGAPVLCLATVLIWAHVAMHDATRQLLSEGMFLAFTLFGLAAALAYARRDKPAHLLAAALLFALATLTRTSGAALLLIPVLLVALDGRLRFGPAFARLALVAGASAALLLGGMWANMQRHGHFEIGSYANVSLLGKALLLLPPGPHRNPVLDEVAPLAAQARDAIAAAPDFPASLRAQTQAYEELRWPVFLPAAMAAWPEFGDGRGRDANVVAGRIARAIIADQPAGYLWLVARDWAALVIYPNFLPLGRPQTSWPPPFEHCPTRLPDCWALVRYAVPFYYVASMLTVSFAGLLATAVLFLGWGARALRRRLAAPERAMVALVAVAQASLLATALYEAGIWRYTPAVHIINIAAVIWLLSKARDASRHRAARAG